MYSDMSIRTIACSESNMNSASARASSVLPTPVGPMKRKRADRAVGVLQPGARAAQRVGHGLDGLVLADHALVQALLHVHELLATSDSMQPRHGDARPAGHHLGHVLVVDLLLEEGAVGLQLAQLRLLLAVTSSLELGDLAVAQLGGALRGRRRARRARRRGGPAPGCSLAPRMASMASFSPCQCAFISFERSRRSASSRSIASRRATLASSFSFFSAWCSISSCWMRRSTSSISSGIESISMRSREAASSIRSIALSGRKRSAM